MKQEYDDKFKSTLAPEARAKPHGPSVMPVFVNAFQNPPQDDQDETSSEEEEEEEAQTKSKEKQQIHNVGANVKSFERMPHPIIVDSGAALSVLPKNWCPQAQLQDGKAKGKEYTAANGSSIYNLGEKVVSVVTQEGHWKNIKFQVCNVTRPLASVHKICEAGHSVIFNPSWDERGSFIVNHQTGDKTWMREKEGVFVLDTKVAPTRMQEKPSFGGPGR